MPGISLPNQASLAPSPCVGVCRMDEKRGWCQGCGSSIEDLTIWSGLTPKEQLAIWQETPHRLAKMGETQTRLPWSPDEIFQFASETLKRKIGAWQFGPASLGAVFPSDEAADVTRQPQAHRLEATSTCQSMEMILSVTDKTRAFGLLDAKGGISGLVLALPEGRVTFPPPNKGFVIGGWAFLSRSSKNADGDVRVIHTGLARWETSTPQSLSEAPHKSVLEGALQLPPAYKPCAIFGWGAEEGQTEIKALIAEITQRMEARFPG